MPSCPFLPSQPGLPRNLQTLGRRAAVALIATLLLSACSSGAAGPVIEDPWIRSNPNGIGAAYLTVTMPADDRLTAAEVDASVAGRVEVHEVIDDEGMMRMREIDGGIPLPAGSPVQLRPGGYHLMLLDMPGMLEIGSTVDVTLRFAAADAIVVAAEVREGADLDAMHHHEHGADGMPHSDHHGRESH